MGFWIAAGGLVYLMMTADQWGGPHWLVGLGNGICSLATPTAIIAIIYLVCHDVRTTSTHSEPSHDDRHSKDR